MLLQRGCLLLTGCLLLLLLKFLLLCPMFSRHCSGQPLQKYDDSVLITDVSICKVRLVFDLFQQEEIHIYIYISIKGCMFIHVWVVLN